MGIKGKTTLAITCIIIFGFCLFFLSTNGFKAFTSESARTYELNQTNPKLPTIVVEDSKERVYALDEFAKEKYLFLTFMYTNCGTVCPQLELNMAEVYKQIPSKYIGENIVFLSISFDTSQDSPEVLEKYRTYFDSDGETWRMARVPNQEELDTLLRTLGVIVIPDGYGNFQHNTAFYFIDPDGYLLEVMDYNKTTLAANIVNANLED